MSFVHFACKLIESSQATAYEMVARDVRGRDAYYIVKVPFGRDAAFHSALKQKDRAFDLRNYGVVLVSGFGSQVPETLRQRILSGDLESAA